MSTLPGPACNTPGCIRAVIFDLDGTLLDTESLSDMAVLMTFGKSFPPELQEELRRGGNRLPWELKKQLLGKRGDEWVPIAISYAKKNWGINSGFCSGDSPPSSSVTLLWNAWEQNLNVLCRNVKECVGATALVETLTEIGIPMAIATSSRMASVTQKRAHNEGLFAPMVTIVTGDDPSVRNGKPAPDIFLEAARRREVDPKDCLVFEDSISGCQSAKAAGCIVIAVPDSRMEKSAFDGIADQVLADLTWFDMKAWALHPEESF